MKGKNELVKINLRPEGRIRPVNSLEWGGGAGCDRVVL